ncbi:MAG TPA: YoaK family protein [Stellaceae bacterium]|nr:YoaK family protein [Stellaceae bacterium]
MPLAFAFAAIAGYADAIGYLRFKAFAGMMTGNTVLMGLALFHRADLPVAAYAGVIAIFLVASGIGYALLRRFAWPPVIALLAEAAMLLLADASAAIWTLVPLVVAMGLQNPLSSRLEVPGHTTFITGNLLHFAQSVTDRISGYPKAEPGFAVYGLAWLGYAMGAALAAAGFLTLRWPLVIPVLALVFVYAAARRAGKLSTSGR